MKNNGLSLDNRLKNMKDFYLKVGSIVDKLPDAIPVTIREQIKEKMLGDKKLKELMEAIDNHRPPRFLLVGRTGVGKSSLINALCGCYAAKVSDTKSCTSGARLYKGTIQNRVLLEILDTRGIAESQQINENESAEKQLLDHVNDFFPDVAILMLNCTHRDSVGEDVDYLNKIITRFEELNKTELPVIVVVNKADEAQPSRFKDSNTYPDAKKDNIDESVRYYKDIIIRHGLKIQGIIAVSSYIEWRTNEGSDVSVEEINTKLSREEIDNLQIAFDGRFEIEELIAMLEEAIIDFRGKMGLRMAHRLDVVVKQISNRLIGIFSGIAGTVALTPIPISDIYILIILEAILVALIAALSGRDFSIDTAREFIFSVGGIGGMGYLFRLGAQQASKLLNIIFPGSGSVVSTAIASGGTALIGKAAIAYYIDDKPMDEAKRIFGESKSK